MNAGQAHVMNQGTSEVTAVRAWLVEYGIRAEIVSVDSETPRVWVPAQDFDRATRLIELMPIVIEIPPHDASSACDTCADTARFESCWTCARP